MLYMFYITSNEELLFLNLFCFRWKTMLRFDIIYCTTYFPWLFICKRTFCYFVCVGVIVCVCVVVCRVAALTCVGAQGLAPSRWNENKQAVRSNHIYQTLDMWMHHHICPSVASAWGLPGPRHRLTEWFVLMTAVVFMFNCGNMGTLRM